MYDLWIYKKTLEIYLSKEQNNVLANQFYKKLYPKCEDSIILPCYGYFTESKRFLFKFVLTKKIEFNQLTDTEKSELIFKLLECVVTYQEFGFSSRAINIRNFMFSYENKIYYVVFNDICSINETKNCEIGYNHTMSFNQYKNDLCSPSTMVFVFAKIVNNLFTKEKGIFEFKNDKMNFLLEECLKINEDEIPNSLLLLIQIHKKNIYLPKTNISIMDSIFHQFFYFLLSSGAKGGKYLTSWSEALDGNPFKHLILNNLKLSFIVHYSNTEFQLDLNKLLNEDSFPNVYDIADVLEINFFATILKNEYLIKETNDMISEFSKADRILNQLILFNNLKINSDEKEKILFDDFIEKIKIEFFENFNDCIKKSCSYYISPSYILSILNEKKLQYTNSHDTIRYLLDTGNSYVTENECLEILLHFEQILYSDVCELNRMFNTQIFSFELKSKIQNKPIFLYQEDNNTLLDDIFKKLAMSLELNDQIENSLDQNDNKFNKILEEKQQKFNHKIDEIEKEQRKIKLIYPK